MVNVKIVKKGTIIGRAVDLHQRYSSLLFVSIFTILWFLAIASVGVILNQYLIDYIEIPSRLMGLSFIVLSVFLFYIADRSFFLTKVQHPKLKTLKEVKKNLDSGKEINLYEEFSFELAKATKKIFDNNEEQTDKNLILSLTESQDLLFILNRLGISKESFVEYFNNYTGKKIPADFYVKALDIAILEGHHYIEIGDVFIVLCSYSDHLKKLLTEYKLELIDLMNVVYWRTRLLRKEIDDKKHLDPAKLKMTGGIGRDWAFGWTPFLKQFAVDLTREIESQGLELDIVGHDKEIKEIKEALLRSNGGNAVLVGEAGVGKNTTVMAFAKKVLNGETYSALDFQHLFKVDTDYLISGLTHPGEVTERITGLLNEVGNAGNIIIYVENFENLLTSGDAGKVDASEVLLPFLDHSNIHIIATCDIASFNQYILPNSSLVQKFTRVNVEEPDEKEVIRILEDCVPIVEYKSKTFITYEALKEVATSAEKYIINLPNPEKSINLLDSVAARANAERGKTILLPKDVTDYVTEKFEIPAGEVDTTEKNKLLNLENIMHERVIGQNEAINAIANALRRARAGVTNSKKPIGSFLFLGPTGVGKTETAKALARTYFGGEEKMIRFDMSEYQNKEDVFRFLGSNLGGAQIQGVLPTAVREHPFSLLLFDEIEKAHRDILDLFLQMLDEGFITDGFGRKVSFSNTIIIATSNAGANIIRQSIKNGEEYEKTKKMLIDYLQQQNIYRPEFLNRFSGVIAFSPLSQEDIVKVCQLLIAELSESMQKNKKIKVNVAFDAIQLLSRLGYDPQMGARPMARVIEDKLENMLAKKILNGEVKQGDIVNISARDIT